MTAPLAKFIDWYVLQFAAMLPSIRKCAMGDSKLTEVKHTRASTFPGNVNQIEAPPNPSVSPKRVPGIAQSLALVTLYGGVVIVVTIALLLISRFAGVSLDIFSYLLPQQIIAWPITLWVGLRWSEASFLDACRLTRFPVRIVPALFIAFFGLTILVIAGASLIPMPEVLKKVMAQAVAARSRLVFFLPLVLGAPVGEELFFRGLVLRGFLGRYSVTKAVWASALLWAVAHLNPWQALGALPLGLVLAWVVVRTGSLIPAIIGHMIANFSPNYVFPPLALALGGDAEALNADHFPPTMLAIGGAMAGIGGFVLWRQLAKLPNDGNAYHAICKRMAAAPRSAESFCHDQRKIMSARANLWVVASAVTALILGAILSRAVEPGVRVEKVMLTGNTPAVRLFPATPGPHPIALLAHGATGSKENLFRFGEALGAAGFECYSVDQAGHGESPRPCSLTNIRLMPRELQRPLGAVDVFIGHSMGGGVGAWGVREAGFRPKLFIGVGAPVELGEHGPPLLLLAGLFEEFFRPARLQARTNAQVVISPWSDHCLEPFDPVLVRAAVKAACATVGKPVPAAPTAWRWRFAGLVLGIAGALVLMFRLSEIHPHLARTRRWIVPAVLLIAIILTMGTWIGVTPQLRRIPLQLVLLIVIWLALAGLSRLRLPRWSLAVVTGILALGFLALRIAYPTNLFLFAMLMNTLAISTLLLLAGVAVGRIATRGGSRRDGDVAMAIFASYVIGQFMPLFY